MTTYHHLAKSIFPIARPFSERAAPEKEKEPVPQLGNRFPYSQTNKCCTGKFRWHPDVDQRWRNRWYPAMIFSIVFLLVFVYCPRRIQAFGLRVSKIPFGGFPPVFGSLRPSASFYSFLRRIIFQLLLVRVASRVPSVTWERPVGVGTIRPGFSSVFTAYRSSSWRTTCSAIV